MKIEAKQTNNFDAEFIELAGTSGLAQSVSLREACWTWTRVAVLSFGGPAGQIAVMHRILVEEKHWIGETRFLHALNYCMLLPGPEAHQLAVYIGWLMHRVRGGVLAGTLFVLPGLISLGALSWLYAIYGSIGIVGAIFFGMKAAVLAIVLEAVVRIGKRTLKSRALVVVAGLAFLGIFFFAVPFPIIIAVAALTGFLGHSFTLDWFKPVGADGPKALRADSVALIDAAFAQHTPDYARPTLGRLLRTAIIGSFLWFSPLIVLLMLFGPQNVFTTIAAFNSKMAVVTFGGAYSVLAYMAQQAVQHYHWLKPGEMLVGLGFAETTPGPLISVVQFVGFIAALHHSGSLNPVLAGMLGGMLAMWSTFVPSFLWIFLGGPYMEALIDNRILNAALTTITAAVVGVVLNLAVWFALHALFDVVDQRHVFVLMLNIPVWSTINWPTVVISLAAIIAIFRFKAGMISVLASSCVAGIAYYLALGAP